MIASHREGGPTPSQPLSSNREWAAPSPSAPAQAPENTDPGHCCQDRVCRTLGICRKKQWGLLKKRNAPSDLPLSNMAMSLERKYKMIKAADYFCPYQGSTRTVSADCQRPLGWRWVRRGCFCMHPVFCVWCLFPSPIRGPQWGYLCYYCELDGSYLINRRGPIPTLHQDATLSCLAIGFAINIDVPSSSPKYRFVTQWYRLLLDMHILWLPFSKGKVLDRCQKEVKNIPLPGMMVFLHNCMLFLWEHIFMELGR